MLGSSLDVTCLFVSWILGVFSDLMMILHGFSERHRSLIRFCISIDISQAWRMAMVRWLVIPQQL